jgi:hypothetical protein
MFDSYTDRPEPRSRVWIMLVTLGWTTSISRTILVVVVAGVCGAGGVGGGLMVEVDCVAAVPTAVWPNRVALEAFWLVYHMRPMYTQRPMIMNTDTPRRSDCASKQIAPGGQVFTFEVLGILEADGMIFSEFSENE